MNYGSSPIKPRVAENYVSSRSPIKRPIQTNEDQMRKTSAKIESKNKETFKK